MELIYWKVRFPNLTRAYGNNGRRQWRSNGRFSRFKEPGPPTVRDPRPTASLVRQAVNTCHGCKTQVQRDRYIKNKEKLKSASLGSLAFSNFKKTSQLYYPARFCFQFPGFGQNIITVFNPKGFICISRT